jgi:hypothetical protein|nr:MAG TPA: protein of unknown function (DUF5053) [Caudoviricetes sp.]
MEQVLNDIERLKLSYREAKTGKEKEAILNEVSVLASKDNDSFSKAVVESIKATNKEAQEYIIKEKLKDILGIISASYIAKNYFNKTTAWFYQRLNNNIVNGKQARFSKEEIEVLRHALEDISCKINNSAAQLVI